VDGTSLLQRLVKMRVWLRLRSLQMTRLRRRRTRRTVKEMRRLRIRRKVDRLRVDHAGR
jgi:hypothetical protein